MATFKANFIEEETLNASFQDGENLTASFGDVQFVHTDNYDDLINKPSINEVVLTGNKTLEDLGDTPLSNVEIKAMFDKVFKGGN